MSMYPTTGPIGSELSPQQLLTNAARRFMTDSAPSEMPDRFHNEAYFVWRSERKFGINPASEHYGASIVIDECCTALAENQYRLAATSKAAQFSQPSKGDSLLKQLLTKTVRLQLAKATHFVDRLIPPNPQELLEPRIPLQTNMQDIALLHSYLQTLCTELNRRLDTEYSPRQLTFAHVRLKVEALKDTKDKVIAQSAAEILALTDNVRQRTTELVQELNIHYGSEALIKDNLISLSSARGR